MRTIGTITFHESINYGAILQAFALQKTLGEMGYASEVIDYRNPRRATAPLSRARRLQHFFWQGVKTLLAGTLRQRRTEVFRRTYLRLSERKYRDARSLHEEPPLYDAYITGSDQVWNPRNNNNDSSYFLTFAPPGRVRISYAASFGVSKLPQRYVADYAEYLSRMHWLSVRENEGKQTVKDLIDRDAELVLDPTLLLTRDQWGRMAVRYESAKAYILCYYMPGDRLVNHSITALADHVSSQTGLPVVSIGQKEYMRLHPTRRAIFTAGPAEFLGLFEKAAFVVTNSFHGTAFSIIYSVPFWVPYNQGLPPEKALHSRIATLLKTLGLEHRLLVAGSALPGKSMLDMDFQEAEAILDRERQKSIGFLRKALGET